MSLVFAAITPHPPLLIPTIGKQAIKKVEKTKQAMEQLEQDLYLARPEIIIIISPHGSYFRDAFTMNVCPEYITDLREFGDLATRLKFSGEPDLWSELREAGKRNETPIAVISEKELDHGCSVPLFYLANHLPGIKILPIGFCDLDSKAHLDFGNLIKDRIMAVNKRVAVIASGDLSHALLTDAPAGYNPAGKKFDEKIQELLSTGNVVGMLNLDKQLIAGAAECGFRSFLILMGILQRVKYAYKQYSYEGPFGVGYLTANFVLSI